MKSSQHLSLDPAHPATFATFGDLAGRVGDAARRLQLEVPGFQSLPAHHQKSRVIRRSKRLSSQSVSATVVAVRLQGRCIGEVVIDLVDGVVWLNGDEGRYCDRSTLAVESGFPTVFSFASSLPVEAGAEPPSCPAESQPNFATLHVPAAA
jgi:hypothetical protein